MPVMTIVAIAVVLYVAYRIWREWAERRAAMKPLADDPATHTEEEIRRSMQAFWKRHTAEQLKDSLKRPGLTAADKDELRALRRSTVEIRSFERRGDEEVSAEITILPPGYEPLEPYKAICRYHEGYWMFWEDTGQSEDMPWEVEQNAVIGEPVVLQTSWKEPPFAITVLGRPERIEGDRERVRVPVRFTGIVHRWSHFSVSGYPALMYTSENYDGERVEWASEFENEWGPEFDDFALVEGGTYDRFIYFRAGDDEERKTIPRRRFVELNWLDDSETAITVDLTKNVEPPERIAFRDGVPEHRLEKDSFDEHLRGLGSQWADLGDAPIAGIGDVVKVATNTEGGEWWDVTALGVPEQVAEDMVRLPVRVTSRFVATERFSEYALQIGTTPDEFGVIQYLWEPRDFEQESGRPVDCLHSVELQRNETREGAMYFSPTRRGMPKEPPTKPFSTLWYGVNYMEMPISLAQNV